MPRVRDEIVRKLWRGEDPFLSSRSGDAAPDLQGWGSQHHYLTEAIDTLRPTIIVEIGVWKGASVVSMASRLRDLAIDGVVIAVDTWLGSWDHWLQDQWFRDLHLLEPAGGMFAGFLRNVRSVGLEDYIVPLPVDSLNAAQVLRLFNIFPDVVHIDAGHDHAAVLADIGQWWPLLQPGGLMIGADYRAGNDWPGVKRAFDDYFRPLELIPLENTDEKCRVSKPRQDRRACDFLSVMRATGSAVSAWRETRRLELDDTFESDTTGVEERLRRYARFDGPTWPPLRQRIMDRVAGELSTGGQQFSRDTFFGAHTAIKVDAVRAVLPGFTARYQRPAPIDGFERFELLAELDNPFARFALPAALNVNMGKARSPALAVYRTGACDLFLTPLGYQLFRESEGIYWPAASTRAYPREAMEHPRVFVNKCVVLVQDVFEGTNYSHFLFDWIPRLGLFLNSGLADPASCMFVMGGAPAEFHFHVIQAMCEIYSLNEKQFVFPESPQLWHIDGPVYFFSDLKETIMHPAHMANRRSMAIMRDVASRIRTPPSDVKRIYISRGDTPLRRIANEAELSCQLRSLGFVEVQLAAIPFLEQIRLVRGADVIVAPHGMGLTHIAFHERGLLVVELHNPAIGTDAYAFISHALGFRYRAILGASLEGEGHHFTIQARDVIGVLSEERIAPPPETGDTGLAGPHAVFYGGVQSTSTTGMPGLTAVGPPAAEYRHVRDDPAVQPDNNVGWLEAAGLITGAIYHGNCDVWLPHGFKGERMIFESAGNTVLTAEPVNLAKRDEWQTVSVNAVADRDVVNFVLRCDADPGAVFYSRNWCCGAGAARISDRAG